MLPYTSREGIPQHWRSDSDGNHGQIKLSESNVINLCTGQKVQNQMTRSSKLKRRTSTRTLLQNTYLLLQFLVKLEWELQERRKGSTKNFGRMGQHQALEKITSIKEIRNTTNF